MQLVTTIISEHIKLLALLIIMEFKYMLSKIMFLDEFFFFFFFDWDGRNLCSVYVEQRQEK